ncbi:type VII secretion protein EssB [Bacillus pseudomycoides]|nr:type VII secretion protein EssB [Bacillus pseudomycoides]
MVEKTIQIDSMNYRFEIGEETWKLELAQSQTRVKDFRQFDLLMEKSAIFVPVAVEETEDAFVFSYEVSKKLKKWDDIKDLERNEKLRLLRNVARFKEYLHRRITFFLHPENLVFDANHLPFIVHRGIREIVPPAPITEEKFLLQYKCLIIALFSKKYSYDELYNGVLKNVKETTFEQNVVSMNSLDELIQFIEDSFEKEQRKTEKNMQIVPKKNFKRFKYMAYSFAAATVILIAPLAYYAFMKVPYQNTLLEANKNFLATDYDQVISNLRDEDAEGLPLASKYELAYSYVKGEKLGDQQKASIMKNISLKSDENYLLYWIYNGKGDFNKSLDIAKQIDDPQLIMYGLIKQIESVKNNPKLSGKERDEKLKTYQQQLDEYKKKYSDTSDEKDLSNTNQ